MILVPALEAAGVQAAVIGIAMSTTATPLGFTFCPFAHGSVERWNFLAGCVDAYFRKDGKLLGEIG